MTSAATTGATGQTGTTAPKDPMVGLETGRESALSNYVGPYVTEMLGRGQALASEPYQTYTGPLTAGASNLQTQAFQGLAGLTIPTSSMGAFTPQTFTADQAKNYMNPYLGAALDPQIAEMRRQADITRVADAGRLTKAGAYGGSRQAIMESEGNRALMDKLSGITGSGYKDAYDKAMAQFNVEQGRGQTAQDAANQFGLAALQKQTDVGGIERGIESEGITADRAQFETERDYPLKQVQYMQSLLQNLPLATQQYSYTQPSAISQAGSQSGGLMDMYDRLFGGKDKAAPAK
jgi:hypothetical protein